MTLYMFWDGLSVHHQDFKTVHVATGICQTDTAVCLIAGSISYHQADRIICLTNACCYMYSLQLLMMGGKTVRNMCNVILVINLLNAQNLLL